MEVINQYVLPALDTLLIATIIYQGYRLLRSTRAIQLIKGVVWLLVIFGVAFFLRLNTLFRVINFLLPSLVVTIALIFQPELRQIFNRLGRRSILSFNTNKTRENPIAPVLTAVKQLLELRRGGLVVFMRKIGLQEIVDSGVGLNAVVSNQLLFTIFAHNTPLHDGAVIIAENKIVAAKCILPLSVSKDAVINLGTRHRAGLGVAEESDAVALIISEESSALSLAYEGIFEQDLSIKTVQERLQMLLGDRKHKKEEGVGGELAAKTA